MTVLRFYRLSLWLPIVVPALEMVAFSMLGIGAAQTGWALEAVAWSLIVGGVPYAALALWARTWMRDRSEAEIRRLMLLSPLLMVALFGALALGIGLAEGRAPGAAFRFALLGASVIIPLGYAYVAIVALLRHFVTLRAA